MKFVLALAATTALTASVAAAPAAALAQSYEHRGDDHQTAGRVYDRAGQDRHIDDHRGLDRQGLAGGPAIRAQGRADVDGRFGNVGYGRRGAPIDNRAGYADRPYAYTGRDGRYRDRFGLGIVSTGYGGGYYDAGYADNGYADNGYAGASYANNGGGYIDAGQSYDSGQAYDGGQSYDSGQGYAANSGSPFIAGSYAAALEQGYSGGGQVVYDSAPVYESVTTSYSSSYAASSGSCGQWTWDPAVGRYVWAC